MTLGELRYRTMKSFGLDIANGDERSMIDQWAYEATLDFLRQTKMTKKTAELSLSAGIGDYELSLDIMAFEDPWIEFVSGNQSRLLRPVDSYEIHQRRLYESVTTGDGPAFYALEGENLLLIYPSPASSGDVLNITFLEKPAPMTGYTQDPTAAAFGRIPQEHHPVLESYVRGKAAGFVRDQQGELFYMSQYDEGVRRSKGRMNTKGGVRVSGARVGRRRREIWPRHPGVDLG